MAKNKILNVTEAVSRIKDNDVIHFGGFYSVGTAENIVDEILRQGQKNLTIINNDGGTPTEGTGKLIVEGRVKKLICTWCGLLPMLSDMVDNGEIELELNPQGTLAERIRAAGFGLGGILTPTGLGTIIEEKWGERMNVNGKDWLYHTPLKADIAIIEAYEADEIGNLRFTGTQNNFNQVMCYAADHVIASVVTPIKKCGEIDPNFVTVQAPMIDVLVQSEVK